MPACATGRRSQAREAAAEAAFREAMRESLLAGHGREAARALLELALLYARQDRSEDLLGLAEELSPICRVPGVGMSVTMALLFFRKVAAQQAVVPGRVCRRVVVRRRTGRRLPVALLPLLCPWATGSGTGRPQSWQWP